jgi:signal transduction histidine kinase
VQLAEAARSAELLTDYSARRKGASVQLDFPPDLLPVRASRAHIERLLINAVSNSLSFVPEGGRVGIAALPAAGGVALEITDNGPGFPEKMLAEGVKAFGTTRRDAGGTGLGLFVCDQIARRHGGTMRIGNLPGGGARISVFLPYGGP